jgi:hypothetical protein
MTLHFKQKKFQALYGPNLLILLNFGLVKEMKLKSFVFVVVKGDEEMSKPTNEEITRLSNDVYQKSLLDGG